MPRIWRTASFRLTLGYLLLFGLSALALLAFVYQSAASFIEQQTQDTIDAEIRGLVEQYQTRGILGLNQVIQTRAAAASDRRSVYYLESAFGTRLAGNIDRWPEAGSTGAEGFRFKVLVADTRRNHTVLARLFRLTDGSRLLVGRDIEDRLAIQSRLMQVITSGAVFMLFFAGLGGVVMSRRVLGRIDLINKTASRIMADRGGRLGERIARTGSGDEFDDLAINLNHMLGRIEGLVQSMREVSDNIAHDLRTPLNRIRARLEAGLRDHKLDDEARRLAEETIDDCDQLISTFNALLNIARVEAGAKDRFEKVDLAQLVADAFELYEPLADDAGLELVVTGKGSVNVRGERQLLSQALANLIDNAIKYGKFPGTDPAEAPASIEIGFDGSPAFWVRDYGPGIDQADHARVLERFSRLAADRSAPGNGLGLSLVQAVTRLHGGTLELSGMHPGFQVKISFRET